MIDEERLDYLEELCLDKPNSIVLEDAKDLIDLIAEVRRLREQVNTKELMKQFTKEEAIAFAKSERWKYMTDNQIVVMAFFQNLLFLPFSRLQQAFESVLGRSIWTHEFARPQDLFLEYLGQKPVPFFTNLMNRIPGESIAIVTGDEVKDANSV